MRLSLPARTFVITVVAIAGCRSHDSPGLVLPGRSPIPRHTVPVSAQGCWRFVDDTGYDPSHQMWGVTHITRLDTNVIYSRVILVGTIGHWQPKRIPERDSTGHFLYVIDMKGHVYDMDSVRMGQLAWRADSLTDSIRLVYSPNGLSSTVIALSVPSGPTPDTLKGFARTFMDVGGPGPPASVRAIRLPCGKDKGS